MFSLAGKIARGGLIEVPMGITINEIVEEVGGGIEGGKRFKAVQIGGPSGGCIPAELGHTRVDYEEHTVYYCPNCQTGGRILSDRSLARLLKADWPKTIEELEQHPGLSKPR